MVGVLPGYRWAVPEQARAARHRPALFEGTLEFFRATVDAEARADRTSADWRPCGSDEIIDRPIGAPRTLTTSAEACAEIGPRLAELLETPERRRSAGERG